MKKAIVSALLLATTLSNAGEITLSRSIKSSLRTKIEKDLKVIENFKFKGPALDLTLKVMEIEELNAQIAKQWLNDRVNYVISENALSIFNLLLKQVVYVDQQNVEYPNQGMIPYSMDSRPALILNTDLTSENNGRNEKPEEKGMMVMANIGAALYMGGKNENTIYGMKISRGLFKSPEKVAVTSPRVGIIQIGEGLFSPNLTINRENSDATANSIFRLGTFFHEARHSDGNSTSLGYFHISCPKGHDYEGVPACDENLNGPYTVGTLMLMEMTKACEDNCTERERETLKLMILESANRILPTTHKGERSTAWDASPESL